LVFFGVQAGLLRRDVASAAESLKKAATIRKQDLWGGWPAASDRGGPFSFAVVASSAAQRLLR
jgi:hypothetical protein